MLVGLQTRTLLHEGRKKYRQIPWKCYVMVCWMGFQKPRTQKALLHPDGIAGANLLPALDPRQQYKKFISTFCRVPVVFASPPWVQSHCTLAWPAAWNLDKIIPSSNEGCTHRAKLGTQTAAAAALQRSTVTNNEAAAPVSRAAGQPGFHDIAHAKAILHILLWSLQRGAVKTQDEQAPCVPWRGVWGGLPIVEPWNQIIGRLQNNSKKNKAAEEEASEWWVMICYRLIDIF